MALPNVNRAEWFNVFWIFLAVEGPILREKDEKRGTNF